MIDITIVGAGHYGRELIGPKYAKRDDVSIKALISPSVSQEVISKSSLNSAPLYRDTDAWAKSYGKPTTSDVFDLCIHPDKLPNVVQSLVQIGAHNFIFPKPIAFNEMDLNRLLGMQKKYDLKIAIASQWHYSNITKELKNAVGNSEIDKVHMNFSKFTENIGPHTLTETFVPHMLQILYSSGISLLGETPEVSASDTDIKISMHHPNSTLESDLKSTIQQRKMDVLLKNGSKIEADYLAVFKDGKFVKYPSISADGKRNTIEEDNLDVMLDTILYSFSINELSDDNPKLMTLKSYLPIAKEQLAIENLI